MADADLSRPPRLPRPLRRDGDLVDRRGAGRRASGGGRDPPPRDRRRRTGARCSPTSRTRDFPLVTNLFGTARRAELAFGDAAAAARSSASSSSPRRSCRRRRRSSGARATSAARRLQIGSSRRARGPVTEVVTRRRPARPAARADHLAGGRRPVRHAAARLHRASGRQGHNLGMYRLQVHDARTTGMHWQIGKGGGFHYQVAEARNQALPVTVFLGGPPALILAAIAPLPENVPELMLASLIAGERLPLIAPGPGPIPLVADAEFALIGEVAPRVRRPEGPFGDHYGYYSLQHDYPVFEVERIAHRRGRDLPRDGRRQAAAGGLLHRRSPAGAAVAALPAGDAGGRAALVLRRDRLPLARRRRRASSATRARRWRSAFRILGEGQLSLTKFLLRDRPAGRSEGLPRDARARPGAHPSGDRPLRLLEPLDGHARLHRTGGEQGLEGRLARARRSACATCRASFIAPRRPAGVTDVARLLRAAASSSAVPPYADEPGAAARFAAHPAFAGWPLVVLTDEPGARRRAAR